MDRYAAFWAEDLGSRGDVTTRLALADAKMQVKGRIFARKLLVASGLAHAKALLSKQRVRVTSAVPDRLVVAAGETILRFEGPAEGVLAAERLVLNVLGRMSGIATLTRRISERARKANPRCRVAGTRKTTPGFRAFEKEAIVDGGGETHRMGLYDAVLIKDNHLALMKDLPSALKRIRARAKTMEIEVEVTSRRLAIEAASGGARWILIDNQSPKRARKIALAARAVNPRVRIEISGGLNERNVAKYARIADRLSLGILTHSAPAADVSLELFTKP